MPRCLQEAIYIYKLFTDDRRIEQHTLWFFFAAGSDDAVQLENRVKQLERQWYHEAINPP